VRSVPRPPSRVPLPPARPLLGNGGGLPRFGSEKGSRALGWAAAGNLPGV